MSKEAEINTAMQQGVEAAIAHLNAVATRFEEHLVSAYAAGLATGISEYIIAQRGHKDAYDLFQEVADDIVDFNLNQLDGEA